MKKNIILFVLMLLGGVMYSQTTAAIDSTTLVEWSKTNNEIRDYIEANHPEWLDIVLTRDTIDFRKNKVVVGNDKEWIIKPSKINPTVVRLNYKKFKFDIRRVRQDSLQEMHLIIKPK